MAKIFPPWSPDFSNYILLSNFTENLSHFSQIEDQIIKTVFLKKMFCFCLLASKYLETCVNRVTFYVMSKIVLRIDLHGKTNLDLYSLYILIHCSSALTINILDSNTLGWAALQLDYVSARSEVGFTYTV